MTGGPLDELDDYIALPRVSGLAVSPDGSRVVTTVAELNPAKTEYITSDGDLLFTSVLPSDEHVLGRSVEFPETLG